MSKLIDLMDKHLGIYVEPEAMIEMSSGREVRNMSYQEERKILLALEHPPVYDTTPYIEKIIPTREKTPLKKTFWSEFEQPKRKPVTIRIPENSLYARIKREREQLAELTPEPIKLDWHKIRNLKQTMILEYL